MLGRLSENEIEEVLTGSALGRIGCTDGKKIYVIPTNYVYDGKHILAHSMDGLKIDMMRAHPDVCFEVEEMQNFTNWRSVILWGKYQELHDERSRMAAMKAFTEKMMHVKISTTAPVKTSSAYGSVKPVMYRIVITEKTGRFEKD